MPAESEVFNTERTEGNPRHPSEPRGTEKTALALNGRGAEPGARSRQGGGESLTQSKADFEGQCSFCNIYML